MVMIWEQELRRDMRDTSEMELWLILSMIFVFMVFCSCHFPTVSKRFLFGISMAFGFLWVGCFAMLGDGGLSLGLVGTFRVRNTYIHRGMVSIDGFGISLAALRV